MSFRPFWLLVFLHVTRNGSYAIHPFRAVDILNTLTSIDHEEPLRDGIEGWHPRSPTDTDVEELYVEQKLDHGVSASTAGKNPPVKTFQQRYFYTRRYVLSRHATGSEVGVRGSVRAGIDGSKSGFPTYAFLCVGGEGPSLDKSVLINSVHCTGDMIELAMRLHNDEGASVHMFALEHRYYGSSYPEFPSEDGSGEPSSPVTNEHLVYLSSRQALADLAHFIEFVNNDDQFEVDEHVKWITFGGSYPGMMAAWARLVYPDHVHAAVSNSAPVENILDFTGYNNRVGFDLLYEKIGGSAECMDIVVEGHAAVVGLLLEDKHGEVAEMFDVCGGADTLSDVRNARMLIGDGLVFVPAQANDPSCKGEFCSVGNLCAVLVKEHREAKSALKTLVATYKQQHQTYANCTVLDWDKTLSYLASPAAQQGGTRSWLWQTCTEFGFYQTCEEDSTCPFAKGYHPLAVDFEICQKAFGVEKEAVIRNVKETLDYYGGWDMKTTRVLSVNGDVDPWGVQAITPGRGNADLPVHMVKGASHHFWTHEVKASDGEEVTRAREVIYNHVTRWLGEDTPALPPKPRAENAL